LGGLLRFERAEGDVAVGGAFATAVVGVEKLGQDGAGQTGLGRRISADLVFGLSLGRGISRIRLSSGVARDATALANAVGELELGRDPLASPDRWAPRDVMQ
jgi:hypothetical protein